MKKLDFLNREQLQKMHRLGTKRNANVILKQLAQYLSSFREDDQSAIYYLNSDGRDYVNSTKERRKNKFVNHVIMRNDFYIYMGCPFDWENEIKLSDGTFSVICDSYFNKDGKYNCLEVDSTQKMIINRKKIDQYKGLMREGKLVKKLGYFPKLIWLTTTDLRRKQLTALCKGIPYAIYTIDDIR